jgi:hypothetical protein
MDCQQVQWMLSTLLDGRVIEAERRILEEHLRHCPPCEARYSEMAVLRGALRSAPVRNVSRAMALRLRATALREAARQRRRVDFRAQVRAAYERVAFCLDSLMRPLALPAAGGLAMAVLLFFAVMTNFRGITSLPQPGDVPTVLATEPLLNINQTLLDTTPDEISVYALIDEQGRVIDYQLPRALPGTSDAGQRRIVGKSLLFMQFQPATTFGQPTTGWLRVTLRRTQVDVRG